MTPVLHYILHFGLPVLVAFIFFRKDWIRASLFMMVTMLVDLDHLLADPIYDANRCSINFHPLHTYYAMGVYVVMVFVRKPIRWLGIGLLLHMLTDYLDCVYM